MYCLLLHFCDLTERTLWRGLCLSPCFQGISVQHATEGVGESQRMVSECAGDCSHHRGLEVEEET